MGKKKGSELISAGRSHPRFSMMANSLGLRQLLPLILCWAPVLAQRNCELCVTVSGDPTDPLVGIYRKLENEALCVEYGCSYTKDGSPDKVFCFKEGQYQTEAGEECPTEATENQQISTGGSSSSGGSTVSGESPSTGGSTVSGGSSSTGGSTVSVGSSSTGRSTVSGESPSTGRSTVSGGSSSTTTGTLSASTTGSSSCGDDSWTQEGDKCYKIFSEGLLDYFGAKSACQTLGTDADLAAPKTEAIQNVLNNLWTALGDEEADTWIGLDDCGSATSPCDDSADGNFIFSDGSSLAVSSGSFDNQDVEWEGYHDFKDGQPVADSGKRQKQDCIKIDKTLNWDDVNCENTMTYACEKPSTGGSTVSGGSSSTGRSSSTTTGTSSASTASTTGSSSCGDDSWTQEGDKCYKIFSEGLLDYFGAKSACQT